MLVLSRKKGESIQIADNICVTVCEVRGGRVRISIDAPKTVRVVRKEMLDDFAMSVSQEVDGSQSDDLRFEIDVPLKMSDGT